MLRYRLTSSNISNDIEEVVYGNVTLTNYGDTYGDDMCVTITCPDHIAFKQKDMIHATKTHVFMNEWDTHYKSETEIHDYQVHAVDYSSNMFSIIAPKYKTLNCSYIMLDRDPELGLCLAMGFDRPCMLRDVIHDHGEDASDEGMNSLLYIFYDGTNYTRLYGIHVVDEKTVKWPVDFNVEHFQEMCESAFPGIDFNNVETPLYGEESLVEIKRTQTMWSDSSDPEGYNPVLTVEHPRISVDVPISMKHDTRLQRENSVASEFVSDNIAEAINQTAEMEKHVYKPVFISSGSNNATYEFGEVRKINFNLHFRTHSGEKWLTENSDSWNFALHGEGVGQANYYSFDNKSDQSDLLCYLGFTNNDVKYQKNKLKKSFLRLSFYDSDKSGNQTLLAYATIFIDSGSLYSKYLTNYNSNIYKNMNGELVKGVKVDREVDENELAIALGAAVIPDDETVEKYRLSSRLSVSDPAMSDKSGEGFNLYLWADSDNGIIPSDVYMKAEFNHAGYGRAVPMMAPFADDSVGSGFKTNNDIINDWNSQATQYGPAKYRCYSYIKLKCRYDKKLKKHVYYLDPERYGTGFGDILNINLYEARVAFND